MTPELSAANLLRFAAQSTAVVAAGALVLHFLRVETPNVRFAFLRAILVASLLGPLLTTRSAETAVSSPPASRSVTDIAPVQFASPAVSQSPFPLENFLSAILLAGATIRLALIFLGLWRIRQLRRSASPLAPLPVVIAEMRTDLGVEAPFLTSAAVTSPVTLGIFSPVVVVPPETETTIAPSSLRALACHELLHVRRRDCLAAAADEFLLALLWFLPALYWLIIQIRLAREQIVDEQVVAITRQREDYIDLMLATAGVKRDRLFASATPFARPKFLVRRVAALTSEGTMSRFRVGTSLCSCVASTALVLSLCAAVQPVALTAQVAVDSLSPTSGIPSELVAIEDGMQGLLHRGSVHYPPDAYRRGLGGKVVLDLLVAADGSVQEAAVVSGPPQLRAAALRTVLAWQYMKDPQLPRTITASLRFQAPATGRQQHQDPQPRSTRAYREFGRITSIDFVGLTDAAVQEIRQRLPIEEGQMLTTANHEQTSQVLSEINDHLGAGFTTRPGQPPQTRVTIALVETISELGQNNVAQRFAPIASSGPAFPLSADGQSSIPGEPPKRIRIGHGVMRKKLIHQVAPEYPELAKQRGIQGHVLLAVLVTKQGEVARIEVQAGHALLFPAAIEAVTQWRYRPTLVNGQSVEVETTVEVNFSLGR